MAAFFPPSSIEQPMRRRPAISAIDLPTPVEPVNMMKSTASTMAPPIGAPAPVTTWTRSSGTPDSSRSQAP